MEGTGQRAHEDGHVEAHSKSIATSSVKANGAYIARALSPSVPGLQTPHLTARLHCTSPMQSDRSLAFGFQTLAWMGLASKANFALLLQSLC